MYQEKRDGAEGGKMQGLGAIRNEAGLFCRTRSSVHSWWELQEPNGPQGNLRVAPELEMAAGRVTGRCSSRGWRGLHENPSLIDGERRLVQSFGVTV